MPYPLAVAPTGWIAMQGQAFDPDMYPILAQRYPTYILPDLRGEFIRGWDNGRGIDTGRELLSYQEGAIQNIIGNIFGISESFANAGTVDGVFQKVDTTPILPYTPASCDSSRTGTLRFDASLTVSTANETRSRNISFNYICLAG